MCINITCSYSFIYIRLQISPAGCVNFSCFDSSHIYYMSGDAWKEGGIDVTGAMMLITLKIISCAINYNDGLLKEEGLHAAQKRNRLLKLPSIPEYLGYCLCCGSHFAGLVFEIKDYLEWSERKGIWEQEPSPSPCWATLRALGQAAICMGLYLYRVPHFPISRFTEPVYHEYVQIPLVWNIQVSIWLRHYAEKYFRRSQLNWPEGAVARENIRAVRQLHQLKKIVSRHVDSSRSALVNLLHGLLKFEPSERLTAQQALDHPFFNNPNFKFI